MQATYANVSCTPLWHAATSIPVMPKTWRPKPMAAASQSMPVCVSRHLTAQSWSDKLRYCARPPFAMALLKQRGSNTGAQKDGATNLRASPWHADRRCGTTVVHRSRERVWMLSRIGLWHTLHAALSRRPAHQLVDLGEPAMGGEGRTGMGLCRSAAQRLGVALG